jgi:hypothetical protein
LEHPTFVSVTLHDQSGTLGRRLSYFYWR